MPTKVDACFTAIRANFSEEEFSDQEIRQMVQDFAHIQETAGLDEFLEKANQYRKSLEARALLDARKRAMTLEKVNGIKKLITEGTNKNAGDIHGRAQALFTGSAKAFDQGNFSIQHIRNAYSRKMKGTIEMSIKREGMEKLVQDADFSLQLRRELSAPGAVKDPRIQRIAKDFRAVYNFQREELTRLGVEMGEIENYIGWQAYDKKKVLEIGEDGFVKLVMKRLDHEKTFNQTDSIEARETRIRDAYNNIVSGDAVDPTSSRSLHYRNAEATHEVLTAIGQYPSAVESILAQVNYTSRRLALMQRFGPNYKQGFDKVKAYVERVAPAPTREDLVAPSLSITENWKAMKVNAETLSQTLSRTTLSLDNLYADVTGVTTSPSGTVMAGIGNTHRTLVSLQNLGGAFLSAIFPDFATNAAFLKSFDGKGIAGGMHDIFGQYLKTISNRAERAETMALMSVYADDMVGGVSNIFGELNEGAQPGILTDWARKMFTWTGLTDHTQAIRAATAKMLGARLAKHADTKFGELPEQLRMNLGRYGIKEKEWSVISQARANFGDGVVALSPEKVLELPQARFKELGINRSETYLKLATAMNEATEMGTLTGDTYTRTLFYQGTTDDSFWGQMARYIAQFKQAPVQNIRVAARLQASNIKTGNKLTDALNDAQSLGIAAAWMTTMGIASYYAKEVIMKGNTPPPPSTDTVKEGLVRGGFAGIMGDYLMAEYNKSYRNFVADMAGPAIGESAKIMKLYAAAVRGEFKENRHEFLRIAVRQIPGNNVWWAKAAFEHLVLDGVQEWMAPGYTMRMDRKLKGKDQQRIFPSVGVPNSGALIQSE